MFLSGILARSRMRVKTDLLASFGRIPRRDGRPSGALRRAGIPDLLGAGRPRDRPVWTLVGFSFALAVLYGASDEIHQAFVPERSASEADLALDAPPWASPRRCWCAQDEAGGVITKAAANP